MRYLLFRLTVLVLLAHVALFPAQVSGQAVDSTAVRPLQSGTAIPVKFTATDSLIVAFSDSTDFGTLYGNARVDYKNTKLEAAEIELLFDLEEMRARAHRSDTGLVGLPTFTQGSETFSGETLAYNMATERGRVSGARTVFEDGLIRADVAKVMEDSTLYIKNGLYTTCECLDDPSYSLRSSKMKIVDQKWVYTGPIRLFLFSIPTPLWLPFGYLPAQEGRRSGPLPPRYGEDEFGFYLRDGGWYFALNDKMDLQLQLGLWSRGSVETTGVFRYKQRYGYSGKMQIDFARLRVGESGDPDFSINRTGSLRWQHAQTLDPWSSLDANVDLSSSGYLKAISEAYNDRVKQSIGSSISYRKRWATTGRSMTLKVNHNQILSSGRANVTLPSLSFSNGSKQPFKRKSSIGKDKWFEKITYRYNMVLTNSYSFVPIDSTSISWLDGLLSPSDYRAGTGDDDQFDFKATHTVPVSAAFAVSRLPLIGPINLNLSPSLNYTESWFIRTDAQTVDTANAILRSSRADFLALRQFNTGISANTSLYGQFPFKLARYRGLRHTLRTTMAYSYQPDFFAERWGYTDTYTDTSGSVVRYPLVSGVRRGEQQRISLNLNNVFESKIVRSDSLASTNQQRPVSLLNFDASTSYNFAADSLKLNSINLGARTKLFGRVDLTMRSTISPYQLTGTRIVDKYVLGSGSGGVGRLTSLSFTARTSVRSKSSSGRRPLENPRAIDRTRDFDTSDILATGLRSEYQDPAAVVADFAIPWSLTMDFTYGISKPLHDLSRRAIVNATVDFNLTPNWKITSRTGYDVVAKDFSTTNLAIHRDFSCWQMSINWIPFGQFQSWSFDLHVKSGHLRDLLRLQQPRSDRRGRIGSLVN